MKMRSNLIFVYDRAALRLHVSLRRPLTAVAMVGVTLLWGCGGDDGEGELRVAATTGIAADLVAEVAGPNVEVAQIVPDGANPHSYAPSAKEQQALAESDLLVGFSPALEAALPLEVAERNFQIAEHVESEAPAEGDRSPGSDEHSAAAEAENHDGADDGAHDGQSHDHEGDPHVWLDPVALKAAIPALGEELAAVDPAGADGYRERAERFADRLVVLDEELRALVASIPPANRKLVTSHDLMGWFADRYGFEVVGAPFGLSPEAEASAADVAALVERVREAGVPAVFAQQGDDPEVLRLIAEQAEVEIVDDLLLENLGSQASGYAEMMRYSTGRIATALGG